MNKNNPTPKPEPQRNLEAELDFLREMNGATKDQNESDDNDEESSRIEASVSRSGDSDVFSDLHESGGRLVDDDEFVRFRSLVRNGALYDNDSNASIENDENDLIMANTSTSKTIVNDESGNHTEGMNGEPPVAQRTINRGISLHTRSIEDHRLNSPNHGDGTIQKRLQRAILSSPDQGLIDQVEEDTCMMDMVADVTGDEESFFGNDEDLVTMVQDFSLVDDSQDVSSVELPSGDAAIVDAINHGVDDGGGSNLIVSTKGRERHHNADLAPENSYATNDWDDAESKSNHEEKREAKHSYERYGVEKEEKKTCISFDTDCSYLPDEDFATANWDSD